MRTPPDQALPAFIGVDWGSSRLRAYAITMAGAVLETMSRPAGILTPEGAHRGAGGHAAVLRQALEPWLERWPELPVVASGMIGSRGSLLEAPYVAAPAGAAELAAATVTARAGDLAVTIVPGMADRAGERVDVMRGEETIAIGWQPPVGESPGVTHTLVLPGTHTKWLRWRDGKVCSITTFITGELLASIHRQGSLSALLQAEPGPVEPEVFAEGVRRGLAGASLLHGLFSLRAEVVTGHDPRPLPSLLSGLLIGTEVAGATRLGLTDSTGVVHVIADTAQAHRHVTALQAAGIAAEHDPVLGCLARGWSLIVSAADRELANARRQEEA